MEWHSEGLRQPSVQLKYSISKYLPDLLEILSYIENIEYVRQIQNNQTYISYKYQTHSQWHFLHFGWGKYLKNMPLVDFEEFQLKNVTNFCFIILDVYSL